MTEKGKFLDYSIVTYIEKILYRDQYSKVQIIKVLFLNYEWNPSLLLNFAGCNLFFCLFWPVIAKLPTLLLRAFLFVLTFLFDLSIILGLLLIKDYNSGLLKLLFCESMELFPCLLLRQLMKLYDFNLVVSWSVLSGTARFYLWWGSEGSYQVHSRSNFSSHAEPP